MIIERPTYMRSFDEGEGFVVEPTRGERFVAMNRKDYL